jgi:hypothetical protein
MREYLEEHKRDKWDAPVTDEELAKDYPEYGDLVKGLGDLTRSNDAQIKLISIATEWSNRVTTQTASDRNKVSETSIAEPYGSKL